MHARDELPVERVEVIASDAPSENLMGQVEHKEKVAAGTVNATPGGEGTSDPKKRGRGRPPSKGRKGKGQGSGGGGGSRGGGGIGGRGGGSGGGGRGGGGGDPPGNPGADYHGRSFIPHLISVNADEDVILRVINLSQARPRLLCIISASGAVKKVNLRQQDGTVNMREGRFEILSLSGYFVPHQVNIDNNNNPSWVGGISVSLGDSADQVFGGPIGGAMIADTSVHVVVGDFLTGDEKGKGAGIRKHQKGKGIKFSKSSVPRNLPDPAPAPAPDAPPSPPPASATATGGYEPGFMWLGEN